MSQKKSEIHQNESEKVRKSQKKYLQKPEFRKSEPTSWNYPHRGYGSLQKLSETQKIDPFFLGTVFVDSQ